MEVECPICSESADIAYLQGAKIDVSCERCGKYCISIPIASSRELAQHEKRHILAGAIRNRSEQGEKVEILTLEDIGIILDSVSVPSDPFEAIDLLLEYLLRKTGETEEFEELNARTLYPILFAKTPRQFSYYVQKAHELGYIESPSGINVDRHRLALGGWHRLAELRKHKRKSDQAFVAMWFDPSLDEVWKHGFKTALEETGYHPIRVDLTEHNEKICDRIIAEIRKSGLVIADFTGQRGGVYFEAGFAMGLGTIRFT